MFSDIEQITITLNDSNNIEKEILYNKKKHKRFRWICGFAKTQQLCYNYVCMYRL